MNLENGKVLTSKSVGTGPWFVKKNLPGRGLTKIEEHWSEVKSGEWSG